MLHNGIRTRVDQTNVPAIGPPDEERRGASLPSDLQNLGIPIVLSHVVGLDDEPFSDVGLHGSSPFEGSRPGFYISISASMDKQDLHLC